MTAGEPDAPGVTVTAVPRSLVVTPTFGPAPVPPAYSGDASSTTPCSTGIAGAGVRRKNACGSPFASSTASWSKLGAAAYTSAVSGTSNTSAPLGTSIGQPATNTCGSSAAAVAASATPTAAAAARADMLTLLMALSCDRFICTALLTCTRSHAASGLGNRPRRHGREVADDEQQQPDAEERHDTRQRPGVAEVDEEQLRDDHDHQRRTDDPDRAPRAARADDHRCETPKTPDDRQRALERRRSGEAIEIVRNAGPVVDGARDGHRDEEPAGHGGHGRPHAANGELGILLADDGDPAKQAPARRARSQARADSRAGHTATATRRRPSSTLSATVAVAAPASTAPAPACA